MFKMFYKFHGLTGRYCGKNIPETLISSDSRMFVEFRSSGGKSKGFEAKYEGILYSDFCARFQVYELRSDK